MSLAFSTPIAMPLDAAHTSPLAACRRWAYRLSALLAAAYAVYVVVLKLSGVTTGGALGDVGEFLLVLASVTLFAVGLFVDEALREQGRHQAPEPDREPA